jgi:hypothetical protein
VQVARARGRLDGEIGAGRRCGFVAPPAEFTIDLARVVGIREKPEHEVRVDANECRRVRRHGEGVVTVAERRVQHDLGARPPPRRVARNA